MVLANPHLVLQHTWSFSITFVKVFRAIWCANFAQYLNILESVSSDMSCQWFWQSVVCPVQLPWLTLQCLNAFSPTKVLININLTFVSSFLFHFHFFKFHFCFVCPTSLAPLPTLHFLGPTSLAPRLNAFPPSPLHQPNHIIELYMIRLPCWRRKDKKTTRQLHWRPSKA